MLGQCSRHPQALSRRYEGGKPARKPLKAWGAVTTAVREGRGSCDGIRYAGRKPPDKNKRRRTPAFEIAQCPTAARSERAQPRRSEGYAAQRHNNVGIQNKNAGRRAAANALNACPAVNSVQHVQPGRWCVALCRA